jgi:DNA (cytosine-5)-methyltransferase 1
MSYDVISLFTGAGGTDIGFINAGYNIAWANEWNKYAVKSYKDNIDDNIILDDITKVSSHDIPEADVVIGGFPCQGFSISNNNRRTDDQRNFLYLELLRIIKDKKPAVFVAENVEGLLSMDKGRTIKMIIKDFEDIGYKTNYKLLNSAEYGVPQFRKRVIIIGNNIGKPNQYPKPTHQPYNGEDLYGNEIYKYVSVKDVIGHLKDVPFNNEPFMYNNELITNHQQYDNIKPYYYKKVDDPIKHCTKIIKTDKVFKQQLQLMWWNKPGRTVLGSHSAIHPCVKRRLSVRENAILQTFPNDYKFHGSIAETQMQVGNAVPPLLAEHIGNSIKEMIK